MLMKIFLGLNQLGFFISKTTHAALRNCEQLGGGLAIPYAAQGCISTAKNVSIVPIYVMRHAFSLPPLKGLTKVSANHPIPVATEWSDQKI